MKTQQRVAAMPRPWTSLALSGPGSNRRREVATLLGAETACRGSRAKRTLSLSQGRASWRERDSSQMTGIPVTTSDRER